ncbi:MAG: hypothetical protein IJH41_05915 [Eubacterium sp.]|nr:hypothetical protein [Eubacterium sp.]
MSESNTQKMRVLRALKENHNGLTTMQLMSMLGISRPANCICDLRKDGYIIININEQGKNRYGETVSFVRYRLEKSHD